MNSEPNTSPDNDWEAQLAEYTFGTMEPGMAPEFERRLNECIEHATLARQYTELVGMLGYAASPAEPPEGHKSRLMARLSGTAQATGDVAVEATAPIPLARPEAPTPQQATSPTPAPVADLAQYRETRRRSMALPLIATVAAAVVLLLGGWAWSLQGALDDATRRQTQAEQRATTLQGDVSTLQGQVTTLQNQLQNVQAAISFPVQPQAPFTSTVATIAVNPRSNEVSLNVLGGLQALPPNKVYELWWLPAQTGAPPVPAGVFTAGPSGKAAHSAKAPASISNYAAVAVTLEDAPGKPAPGGPIVMVGAYTVP